jgi:hypothetical protein
MLKRLFPSHYVLPRQMIRTTTFRTKALRTGSRVSRAGTVSARPGALQAKQILSSLSSRSADHKGRARSNEQRPRETAESAAESSAESEVGSIAESTIRTESEVGSPAGSPAWSPAGSGLLLHQHLRTGGALGKCPRRALSPQTAMQHAVTPLIVSWSCLY